jgi:very-short-patch-repair endonuclease
VPDHGGFARIARRQHGAVTSRQLENCGYSRGMRRRLVADGRIELSHPLVYVVCGSPRTWEQQCMAAVLAAGPGAAVSHRSAGRLWAVLPRDDVVEVTVPRGRLPRLRDVQVHRSRDLGSRWVTRRQGIPTTNPLMTLIDLGAVLTAIDVEDALDRGLEKRLFSVAAVEWAYNDVARPGRRGCGVLRGVLDERALGSDPPDGLLEPRMARLLRDHGLPPAAFQHPVGAYRVDFAYPDLRLAIEVDGYAVHTSPRALRNDLSRQNALVLLGWTVLRFTWSDVVRRPGRVAAEVRAAVEGLAA